MIWLFLLACIKKDLEKKIPSVTKSNIELPTSGAYDTKIAWKSSNENSISN